MSASVDVISFPVPGDSEEIAGLWFAMEGSVPRLTLWTLFVLEIIRL